MEGIFDAMDLICPSIMWLANQSAFQAVDPHITSRTFSMRLCQAGPETVDHSFDLLSYWLCLTYLCYTEIAFRIRKASQQRLFDVQVFELHRLLKVQKLLAASPNLLLEVGAILSKSSLNVSSAKQLSSEYVVKAVPHKVIPKDVAYKFDKAEGTAENVVPKVAAPVPSRQHLDHPAGYLPANMDPKMNPWGFHQPSSPQWLVPVMSPSEGLVYKPFPAPGFTGPFYGGCGPVGPNPVVSNYGMPPPQYQQATGMPPGIHFGGQSYFPPYGMPMMSPSMSGSTVVQSNPLSGSNPLNPTSQSEGASRCSESPEDAPPREKRARVIKAVPHRSTRESAARIFQSIQQERQANESSSTS